MFYNLNSKCGKASRINIANIPIPVKEFNKENGIKPMDLNDPEEVELQRKYDEARNRNFSHRNKSC